MGNQCVGAGGPRKQENMQAQVRHGTGQGHGHGHGGGRSEVWPVRVSEINPISMAPVETSSKGSVGVEAMSPVMPPSLLSAERVAPGISAAVSTSGASQEEEPAIVSQTTGSISTSANTREIDTRGPIELKETPNVDIASASLTTDVVAPVSTVAITSGKIEVCTAGKCRKGGSQQILASLQESIPESSNISVTSCKCMKNCKSAPNVRVMNSEGQTQVHSNVSVGDVDTLLELHFGVQSSGNQGNATPNLFATIDSGVVVAA